MSVCCWTSGYQHWSWMSWMSIGYSDVHSNSVLAHLIRLLIILPIQTWVWRFAESSLLYKVVCCHSSAWIISLCTGCTGHTWLWWRTRNPREPWRARAPQPAHTPWGECVGNTLNFNLQSMFLCQQYMITNVCSAYNNVCNCIWFIPRGRWSLWWTQVSMRSQECLGWYLAPGWVMGKVITVCMYVCISQTTTGET